MNILIVSAVAAFAVCLLWVVQSIVLTILGEPLTWPLRFATRKPLMRWTSRVMIHVSWLIILFGSPLALGIAPADALHQAFPTPVPWRDIGIAFSVLFFPGLIVYALLVIVGWVRIEPQHDTATRRGKLLRRIFGPVPLATLEEAVFRGILLEQLLRSLPSSPAYTAIAVIVSSAIFSSVHFIKLPYPGKPVWQPAYGYFIVGCLFGIAYILGGRSLWLPIAVHATAVFLIEVMKLYGVHRAPPWLMGYSEWPQSGFVGSLFILGVTIALVVLI